MYCMALNNDNLKTIKSLNYIPVGLKNDNFSDEWLRDNTNENISDKNRFYGEYTFHYWFWKNELKKFNNNIWIGFCQKRRFWLNSDTKIKNLDDLKKNILKTPHKSWKNYESIICKPIRLDNPKKMKLIKKGLKNIIKDPSIFFNKKKQNIKLHFDMHHGYGNLEKATNLLPKEDVNDFLNYIENSTMLNPHIMYISKSTTLDNWFKTLFKWLSNCEEVFGFENLKGYDTGRLYAYLAERYASFWFKKYTAYKEQSWAFIDE